MKNIKKNKNKIKKQKDLSSLFNKKRGKYFILKKVSIIPTARCRDYFEKISFSPRGKRIYRSDIEFWSKWIWDRIQKNNQEIFKVKITTSFGEVVDFWVREHELRNILYSLTKTK